MAENIGSIEVVATINTKDYDNAKKKIEKGNSELESGAAKTSSRFSGAWKLAGKAVTSALVAVTVATGALITKSVKEFANYEQLVGGVDTLFKDSSKTIQKYAQDAYKTAGLSANQYMETVTGFSASLLQGLGGDTKRAAKIANTAVTDMADNANKMGTSIDRIQDAYQGFAKDNFTMLDNLKLGYGGTAGEMARLVNESKVMGKGFKATAENVKDIPFDKLIESIHVVQSEMGITGTTAKEASETISGSLASTKASWTNLLTAFGAGNRDMINQSFEGLVESGTNFVRNVGKILPGIFEGIWQALGKVADRVPVFGSLYKLIDKNTGKIKDLYDGIKSIGNILLKGDFDGKLFGLEEDSKIVDFLFTVRDAAFSTYEAVKLLFTGDFSGGIFGLEEDSVEIDVLFRIREAIEKLIPLVKDVLVGAFNALAESISFVIEFVSTWYKLIKEGNPLITGITVFIGALAAGLIIVNLAIAAYSVVMGIATAVTGGFAAVMAVLTSPIFLVVAAVAALVAIGYVLYKNWDKIKAFFAGLPSFFAGVWGKVKSTFSNLGTAIGSAIGNTFKSVINGIISVAVNLINKFIDQINGAVGAVNKIPGVNIGQVSKIGIPQLAKGGIVSSPTLAMIGEGREQEAVLPLSKLDELLSNSGNTETNKNVEINQYNTVNTEVDMGVVNARLMWQLNRA